MTIRLDQARAIVDGALAAARARGLAAMAVVVLDAGAHPVAFAREDGASLFRFDIARAKATGALGMGADTRAVAARAAANPTFFHSVVAVSGGQLALSAGGVLVRDAGGAVIGAVGASGDTADHDEACVAAAIAAAGLYHGDRP